MKLAKILLLISHLSYPFKIIRRRTETTHQQRVGRFEVRGY